jgi:predicted SprT family Zn-dependent metalloprotease
MQTSNISVKQLSTKKGRTKHAEAKDIVPPDFSSFFQKQDATVLAGRTIHNPTEDTYDSLNRAYVFFNEKLFSGSLPGALITLQRKARSYGFFDHKRFADGRDGEASTDEIALNPKHFKDRSDQQILATLAHEMVHQQQARFGTPPRRSYHDKEWAQMMKAIGLHPSDTAEPGGRETGQKVSHFVITDGPFAMACAEWIQLGGRISYVEVSRDAQKEKAKRESKTKNTCPSCGGNAWSKKGYSVTCTECQAIMIPETAEP